MSTPDPKDAATPPAEPALTPDEERMNAWLDKQLGPADAKAFEDELARDPQRQLEAKSLAGLVSTLAALPDEKPPKHMLADVQSDIRHRSRGRYFGYRWKLRFPYEALLNAALLIAAVVVYVTVRPSPPKLIPVEASTFLVAGSNLGVGARILSDYGSFRHDPETPADGPWLHLLGEVAVSRMPALRTELSLYPSMRIDSEEVVGEIVRVQVAIKR